jgi:hypothetical protein
MERDRSNSQSEKTHRENSNRHIYRKQLLLRIQDVKKTRSINIITGKAATNGLSHAAWSLQQTAK